MLPELNLYLETVGEFDRGEIDQELWEKALQLADGNELAAKYQYIHLRIDTLSARQPEAVVEEPRKPVAEARKPPIEPPQPAVLPTLKQVDTPQQEPSTEEEVFYSMAISELEDGPRDKLIWRTALRLAEGDTRAAKLHYVCLRIESLCAVSADSKLFKKSGT